MLSQVTWRPPRLTTERLILRGFEPSDAPAIHAYSSDPETTQFMAWRPSRSAQEILDSFINGMVAGDYRLEELHYAIADIRDESAVIGSIGLCGRARENRILDLGYILQRDRWGQGLAVEAARAVLAHGFAATSAERIIAPVFAPNHASRRVAEKLGFRLAQITPAQAGDYANRFDEATYVLTRQDFLRGVDLPHLGRPGH